MSRRRIEYVFGAQRPGTGHSLGVVALAQSSDVVLTPQSHGTLFSGGRDGRINAWALGGPQAGTHAARVTDSHTDWVSDLVVHSPDTVVSCSADTTVKLWNVRTNRVSTIGHHTDYAECLAMPGPDVVSSGGLDGKIIGWNMQIAAEAYHFDVGHSVYTLAAASPENGGLLVSGSPDGIVRLWDPRTQRAAGKLTGHTDSVRSVKVRGDSVISCGADATVRVWNLRTGRLAKTLTQFNASVWSITPLAGDSSGFFAGDRAGTVYYSDSLDIEPQILAERVIPEGGLKGLVIDPVSADLWAASPLTPEIRRLDARTGTPSERLKGHAGLRKHRLLNDKRRVLVADTRGRVQMVDLVSAKRLPFERQVDTAELDTQLDAILDEVNTMDVLDSWCQVQIKTGQICVTLDRMSINNTEVYLDDLQTHVSQTVKTPLPTPQASPIGSPMSSPMSSPLATPAGSGFFRQGRSPAVSRVTSTQSLSEVVKLAEQRRNADQRAADLRAAQKKLGTGQGRAKFYDPGDEDEADEETFAKPPASAGSNRPGGDTEEPADSETADDEIRINLGNWVLTNLLRGVIERREEEYRALPEPPAAPVHREMSPAAASQPEPKETKRKGRFLSRLLGRKKDEPAPASSNTPTSSGSNTTTGTSAPAATEDSSNDEPESTSFQEAWSRAVAHHSLKAADPEAPTPDALSRRTKVVVTEIAPGAGAPTEIFSTTVGTLIHSASEAERIEKVLPGWVGDAVLLGKLHVKSPTKIGFSVRPTSSDLPELTPDNTRLMAISMLRTRKIMAYTVGQLQQHKILSAEAANYAPDELVEITCLGQPISAHTTLATIRTRIWRKGGDVIMQYSLKKRV